jgi:hypothetical protein
MMKKMMEEHYIDMYYLDKDEDLDENKVDEYEEWVDDMDVDYNNQQLVIE